MNFTLRKTQILDLIRHGQTNKDIGQNLGISANTVRDHIRRVMLRTGLKTRVALAALYFARDRAPQQPAQDTGHERRMTSDRRGLAAPRTLQM